MFDDRQPAMSGTLRLMTLLLALSSVASAAPPDPVVRARVPEPQDLVLSLEQIGIEAPGSTLQQVASAHDAAVVRVNARTAILRLKPAASADALLARLQTIERTHPEATTFVVAAPRGAPDTADARLLITREVVFVMNDGAGVPELVTGDARPAGPLKGAYVVAAADPLAAIALADELSTRPGVRIAYVLTKQMMVPR